MLWYRSNGLYLFYLSVSDCCFAKRKLQLCCDIPFCCFLLCNSLVDLLLDKDTSQRVTVLLKYEICTSLRLHLVGVESYESSTQIRPTIPNTLHMRRTHPLSTRYLVRQDWFCLSWCIFPATCSTRKSLFVNFQLPVCSANERFFWFFLHVVVAWAFF